MPTTVGGFLALSSPSRRPNLYGTKVAESPFCNSIKQLPNAPPSNTTIMAAKFK